MTLLRESDVFRHYLNPGTNDDGFVSAEWMVDVNDILWEGGAGDWFYVGYRSTAADRPEMVYAFRYGSESVTRHRQRLGG